MFSRKFIEEGEKSWIGSQRLDEKMLVGESKIYSHPQKLKSCGKGYHLNPSSGGVIGPPRGKI